MPAHTQETVSKRVDALKKTLAEKAESMEAGERRKAQKRLRRAQRKGRKIAVAAARNAPKAKEEPAG